MNRIKQYAFLFVFAISSLFVVKGIYGYFTVETEPKVNALSIEKNTSYTVIHETMNIGGATYSEHSSSHYDNVPIGTEVTPEVLTLNGFTSPIAQTVTLNSFNDTVITYRYTRNQYTLTILDSTHVTTQTPSGTYYYGQEITLLADQYGNDGYQFTKWSNGVTNREYTFNITSDTEIRPIYGNPYVISFNVNGGTPLIDDREVYPDHAIGTLPTARKDDCELDQGTYEERNCTYHYSLEGWYTEQTFENKIDSSYIPTSDQTLYAKWEEDYQKTNSYICNGLNYYDTGINLFSEENAFKDFSVKFTIDEIGQTQVSQAVVFGNMDETAAPWPGIVFRHTTKSNPFELVANVKTGTTKQSSINNVVAGTTIELIRTNGILYYKLNNGDAVNYIDMTQFKDYFDANATFCAGLDGNLSPFRYFVGTLSNMSIELKESNSYLIEFDANGGTGSMNMQRPAIDASVNLIENKYTRQHYIFNGWNTEPDGTGTSYSNKQKVSNLTTAGEKIKLYAQWNIAPTFTVKFDANGGTGTMNDQEFEYGIHESLNPSTFTKGNTIFLRWNTKADGTGKYLEDGADVSLLSSTDGDEVTLYAIYNETSYSYPDEIIFTGSNYINTGIFLFDANNLHRDFEISFEIVNQGPKGNQNSLISNMDESGSPYPGLVFRLSGTSTYELVGNFGSNKFNYLVPLTTTSVVIKAENDELFISCDGGQFVSLGSIAEQTAVNVPLTIGSNINKNGNPDRFFRGTLRNINITIN